MEGPKSAPSPAQKRSLPSFAKYLLLAVAIIAIGLGAYLLVKSLQKTPPMTNGGITYTVVFPGSKVDKFEGYESLRSADYKKFISIYPSSQQVELKTCSGQTTRAGEITVAGKKQVVCKGSGDSGYVTSFFAGGQWHTVIFGNDTKSDSVQELRSILKVVKGEKK